MTNRDREEEQYRTDDNIGDPVGGSGPSGAGTTADSSLRESSGGQGGNAGGSVGAGDRGGQLGSERKVDDALPGETTLDQSDVNRKSGEGQNEPLGTDPGADARKERASTVGRPVVATDGGDVAGSTTD